VAYNILAIRSASDPVDPLYPNLTDGAKGFRTVPNDGRNIQRWRAYSLSVWEKDKSGKLERLGTFTEGVPTIFLTDIRVSVVHHDFKTADTGLFWWGFDNLYLASAALAKFKTRNRAVTGHIPLVSLSRVSVVPADGRSRHGLVRLYVVENTAGSPREVVLQTSLRTVEDAVGFAQAVAQRAGHCWVRGSNHPPALFESLINAEKLEPTKDAWASYKMPKHASLDDGLLGKLGLNPAGPASTEATTNTAKRTTDGDSTGQESKTSQQTLRERAHDSKPPFEVIKLGDEGTESSLGYSVTSSGELVARDGDMPLWQARGSAVGTTVVDPAGVPAPTRLFDGVVEIMLTRHALTVLMRDGRTIAGVVERDSGSAFGVVWPLEVIGGVGLSSPQEPDNQRQLRVVARTKAWGDLAITGITARRESDHGAWLDGARDLTTVADDLARAVATALAIEPPEREERGQAFVYNFAAAERAS
jgi:hypothetical protein